MNRSPGLIETRHTLPDSERETVKAVLARILSQMMRSDRSPRESYDAMMEGTPTADGVSFSAVEAEVPGWWVRAPQSPAGRAILHLHGGGYYMGSARAYRGFVSQIVARTGVDAFVPDYPLAPEHPFPAAYDAVCTVRKWLATQGIAQIALVGDSAGGGLALAAAAQPTGTAEPAVTAIVVFSPLVDLALTGSSFNDVKTVDPILQRQGLADLAARYLNGADVRDRRASPLYSIPSSLPPLAIQVGAYELLLDDARRYAAAAAERGGEVHLDIFEDLHHVFQIAAGELPSSRAALDLAAEFLSRCWEK
jgi:epsilon-lactone hydrolase